MIHFFYSLITFFIAIFFVLLGVLGVIIPYSPTIRHETLSLLLEHSTPLFLFGISSIAIGMGLLANIIIQSRHKYYNYLIDKSEVSIDERIMEHYLTSYWNEVFCHEETPYKLQINDNKIHIKVDFPIAEKDMTKQALNDIQADLRDLFDQILGCKQPLSLSISYRSRK